MNIPVVPTNLFLDRKECQKSPMYAAKEPYDMAKETYDIHTCRPHELVLGPQRVGSKMTASCRICVGGWVEG